MGKFDRYLLSQLLVMFGFFSLVLVMVYWINRAVVLFDQLIANGHSAMVFLEFTALSLPNVIALVLPMAAFAAVIYSGNRLASDSELVVVQATGYSPFRLARPVLAFGIIVALLLSILVHFLVPASTGRLAERQKEIQNDLTARLLREGTFLHPARGVTFYVREITPNGELHNVFLSDGRSDKVQINYSARRAFLVDAQTGPKLIMIDGMSQELRHKDQKLAVTVFEDFVFDVSSLLDKATSERLRPAELSTAQLLHPTPDLMKRTKSTAAELLQRGHARFAQAGLTVVASVVGFAALLIGGFSRFGLWRQIMGAIVVLILLKSVDNFLYDLARRDAGSWPLTYVSTLLGAVAACAMLWVAARPALFRRRRRAIS